jgi:hypothetical protein
MISIAPSQTDHAGYIYITVVDLLFVVVSSETMILLFGSEPVGF